MGLSIAGVIERRAACTSYTLIDTRGTLEQQGDSMGFKTMNKNILAKLPGGKIYDTVYPAGADQNSASGSTDIVNHIRQTLATNPSECFILEGYSQGAAATVNAMPQINGTNFDAVKGAWLIGDPYHHPGLPCNVDNNGGNTTLNAVGISETSSSSPSIPANWISKTLDVCIYGDGICDSTHGIGINLQHLQYINDAPTQDMGYKFVVTQLGGTP